MRSRISEVPQGILERLRGALEVTVHALGQHLLRDLVNTRERGAERRARREAERDRDRRQLPVVIDRLRTDDGRRLGQRVERHDGPAAGRTGRVRRHERRLHLPLIRRRLEVQQRQRRRVALELGRQLEQHLVLVDRAVDRRHPLRAVRVVERVFDRAGRHAQRGGLVAIDVDVDLRAADLEVTRDVHEGRLGGERLLHGPGGRVEFLPIRRLHRELIQALAHLAADPDRRRVLQEHLHADDLVELGPQ